MSLAAFRLSMAARSSRARIKLLESDRSNGNTLIHTLAHLEKQVEDVVVEMIDDPSPMSEDSSPGPSSSSLPEQPILTPLQRRIILSLNKLPNLKKERVFIPRVRNSHAVIVCRDVKRFSVHKRGEGIVRHWADSFIL